MKGRQTQESESEDDFDLNEPNLNPKSVTESEQTIYPSVLIHSDDE